MPLPDDADEKWVRKEHTQIKHDILSKYLVPWTRIVSSGNPVIHYFDGFAGRGYYEDGEPGSPILAMEVADQHSDMFDQFYCNFIEYNDKNYADLETEVNEKLDEVSDNINANCINNEFASEAREMLDGINRLVPTFFFIDPFGYTGVPFEVIADILRIQDQGVEIFLTFMVRDIRRFLEDEDKEEAISEILGTEEWKDLREKEEVDIETEILEIYRNQLEIDADAEYVWPFEVKRPDKRETVYYLIHLTNHFKGFKVMKDIMFNTGAEERMAYLGPEQHKYDDSQKKLFETDEESMDSRISELKDFLSEELDGERLKFWDVMKKTYTDTNLIEKHYRKAINRLEEERMATIHHFPERPAGTEFGLGYDDEVKFGSEYASIGDF